MRALGWMRQLAVAAIAVAILFVAMVVGALALAPSTAAQESQAGELASVNVDSLTLRQAPGLNGAVLAWLPFGTELVLLDGPVLVDGYDWYQVDQAGTVGWSVEGFSRTFSGIGAAVIVPPQVPTVPEARTIWTVSAGFLEIRTDPSASAGVARIVTNGTQLTQTGETVESDGLLWFPVDDIGWVGGQRDGESGGLFPEQYPRYVTADVLNVRGDPSLSGTILLSLASGDAVNVFESSRDTDGIDWFAVDEDGTLWVAAEYLTISPPGTP